jgi:hypothetical protein
MFVIRPNPHPRAPTHPSNLEMLQLRKHIPTPSSSVIFTFGFAFESYEEFGDASISTTAYGVKVSYL